MEPFYGIELVERLDIIPALASLEAWRAHDGERTITLVRSRPDIIASHLRGELYFSNVATFDADLLSIAARAPSSHELRLCDVRRVDGGTIPLAIFDAYAGWPLRDVINRVTCEPAIAAAIALEIYRSYTSDTAMTAVTERGELVRQVLPQFPKVWRSEMPSFTGMEPEISVRGRIREGRVILATMSMTLTRDDRDNETEEAAAAFVAELEKLAARADTGPKLARLLATRLA